MTPNPLLKDWLSQRDGLLTDTSASPPTDRSFVFDFYQATLFEFKRISQENVQPKLSEDRKADLRETLSRLFLFGEGIDLDLLQLLNDEYPWLQPRIVLLLSRLAKSIGKYNSIYNESGDSDTVLDQYIRYSRILQAHGRNDVRVGELLEHDVSDEESEEEDSDGEDSGICDEIESIVTCLMDLLPTLHDAIEAHASIQEGEPSRPPLGNLVVTASAQTYVRQVHDKFGQINDALADRLGEANWQRFVRIRTLLLNREQMVQPESLEKIPAESLFLPDSIFHDSGVGTSAPTQSNHAPSVASHTSFLSDASDTQRGVPRVPTTPAEVGLGIPFGCFICGKTLRTVRSRIDWKMHVFTDLQPYICTFNDCDERFRTFSSRKQWKEHEFAKHGFQQRFRCQRCLTDFDTEVDFMDHLEKEHSIRPSEPVLERPVLATATRISEIPAEDLECPLCLRAKWKSRRLFTAHVGRHMEEIALLSLPHSGENESDEEDMSEASMLSSRQGTPKGSSLDERENPVSGLDPQKQLFPDKASSILSRPQALEIRPEYIVGLEHAPTSKRRRRCSRDIRFLSIGSKSPALGGTVRAVFDTACLGHWMTFRTVEKLGIDSSFITAPSDLHTMIFEDGSKIRCRGELELAWCTADDVKNRHMILSTFLVFDTDRTTFDVSLCTNNMENTRLFDWFQESAAEPTQEECQSRVETKKAPASEAKIQSTDWRNLATNAGGNDTSSIPKPMPPTTPLVVGQDNSAVQWVSFEYTRDRVKLEYTIRCDIETINVEELSPEFKSENCVYPRAYCRKEDYRGNRLNYETEYNAVGWALAELNQCLRGKRGLIQRAVNSWRDSNQDVRLRSRRVRRQAKMKSGEDGAITAKATQERVSDGLPEVGSNDILRNWFLEHLDDPYPGVEENQMFIARTGLSRNQIDTWLARARRQSASLEEEPQDKLHENHRKEESKPQVRRQMPADWGPSNPQPENPEWEWLTMSL